MAQALYRRLRPRLQQYQATTGRQIDTSVIEAILRADLEGERATRLDNERIGLAKRDLAIKERAMKDAAKAAKASGTVQIAGTAIQGAQLLQPATRSGIKTAVTGGVKKAVGVGAQQSASGGAQAVLARSAAPTVASGTAGAVGTSGAAPSTGATGATAASSATSGAGAAMSVIGNVAMTVGGIKLGQAIGKKLIKGRGSTGEKVGGAAGGAISGFAAGGPVGAVVGGIVGAVSDSVVCEELCRQGYIPREVRTLDILYGKTLDRETYEGYRYLFDPVVKWMRGSRLVTAIVKPFGIRWAYEMASRLDPKYKGNVLGKMLLKIGVPLCRSVHRFRTRMADDEGGWHGVS